MICNNSQTKPNMSSSLFCPKFAFPDDNQVPGMTDSGQPSAGNDRLGLVKAGNLLLTRAGHQVLEAADEL